MKYAFKRRSRSGFTLLELLVVLAIIGILVSILTVNFNEARKGARDDVRKSDLKALQLAIELYKSQNDEYPLAGCSTPSWQWVGPGPAPASWNASCDEYIVGLVPDYIAELPTDPNRENEDNRGYMYKVNADRSSYKVIAHGVVEKKLITSPSDEFARCPADFGSSYCGATPQSSVYAVYSQGAQDW